VKNIKDYHAYLKIALFTLAIVALSLSLASPQVSSQAVAVQTREVRVAGASAVAGQSVNVSVELVSQGNENAIGFSLNFDPAILSNPMVSLGSGATGATPNFNLTQTGSGRLGIALAYASNQTFTAGTQQVVNISFAVAANAPAGPTPITFGDQPIVREISDVTANPLMATYTPGAVSVAQPNPSPTLVGLNPPSALAGGSGFTLAVGGLNFVNGSVLRWNGSARNTNFVSASQLTALIPATDIANPGTATITVLNPTPGGGISNGLTFTIGNPAPAITTIAPNSANAGSGDVAVTVNGTGFISGSKVRFNNNELVTTFVSATQLTATIPASSLTTGGAANITVSNPTPGGGISNAAPFTVNNPAPAIAGLSPGSATVGGAAFTLTISGTNFVNGAVVKWNGADRSTNFVSGTQLTAAITAADIASAGSAGVTVTNPAPGGGTSNAANFTINNPTPTITTINPSSVTAGGAAFTLTVNGTNFISGAVVKINGSDRATTFVSGSQLTAAILASDIATGATASITVSNPAPSAGTSNAAALTINNPAPAITTLSPASATVGGPAFTLTVNGTGFVNGSTVRWNGANRATTFVSATNLTAAITAADIATAGAASVTVVNSTPGGGTSNAVNFPINQPNPAPTIASLNPSFANIGGQSFTLTVIGTGFVNNSVVRWNDNDRPTTFVNAMQLRAAIPASDIAAAGTANIRVFTPAPGGGTTNALPLIIAAQVTSVSAASFLGAELAAESIIAGFGVSLATRVEVATTQPLPTDLAGTKVMVRDSTGTERLAPQFFVSPGQANYQMPPGTANGTATVTVTSGDNKLSIGAVQVTSVAPGVFAANANGQGVMAATILRVKPDGTQIFEPVTRFDSATGRFVPVPIDLGPETDQVFLVMYGTGFRLRSALSAVNVKIGGTDVEVLYASVAPGFIGLDQANVRLTRSFIGRGDVDVVMTVEGKMTNITGLNFR